MPDQCSCGQWYTARRRADDFTVPGHHHRRTCPMFREPPGAFERFQDAMKSIVRAGRVPRWKKEEKG